MAKMSGSTKATIAVGLFCFGAWADSSGKFDVPFLGDSNRTNQESNSGTPDDGCVHSKYINWCDGPETTKAQAGTPEATVASTVGKSAVELSCVEPHQLKVSPEVQTTRQAVLEGTKLYNLAGVEIEWNQDGAPGVSRAMPEVEGDAAHGFRPPVHCIARFYGGVPK